MVAVKDADIRLAPAVQRLDQRAHKGVGPVELADVIFPLVGLFLSLQPRHADGIAALLFGIIGRLGIAAVGLHRYGIDKIAARTVVQTLEDLFGQNRIL